MGVDRTSGGIFSAPFLSNSVFNGGDELWQNIQQNVATFINNSGGNASFYSNGLIKARPIWNDVKAYLKGEITFATMKLYLGC